MSTLWQLGRESNPYGGVCMNDLEDFVDLDHLFEERFDRPAGCRCNEQLNKGGVCIDCLQAGFNTPNTEAN